MFFRNKEGDAPAVVDRFNTWSRTAWFRWATHVNDVREHPLVIVNDHPARSLLLFTSAAERGVPAMVVREETWRLHEQRIRERIGAVAVVRASEVIGLEERDVPIDERTVRVSSETDATMYIGMTSGTTGEPKLFGRSAHSWAVSIDQYYEQFHLADESAVFVSTCLSHSLALITALGALRRGGTVVLDVFTPENVVTFLARYPRGVVVAVPTMMRALQHVLPVTCEGRFIVGGSVWYAHEKAVWCAQFPRSVWYEFYGSSEMSFVSYLSSDMDGVPEGAEGTCVGRLFPGVTLTCTDEQVTTVTSEMLFNGYITYPTDVYAPQQRALPVTSDVLRWDGTWLWIAGRTAQLAIVGGVNVSLARVEGVVLEAFDDVPVEVCVFAVPNKHFGEAVVCCLFGEMDDETFYNRRKKVNGALGRAERPTRYVRERAALLLGSGKIDVHAIRKRLSAGKEPM